MSRWEDISPEIISAEQSHIYSSWDPAIRHRIRNLNEHPLLDDNGIEIPIYDRNGKRIPRRKALGRKKPLGVLAKLRNLDTYLPGHAGAHYQSIHQYGSSFGKYDGNYYVYPQAGTSDYGHIQSHVLPDVVLPRIFDINKSVSIPRRVPTYQGFSRSSGEPSHDEDEDSDDMGEFRASASPRASNRQSSPLSPRSIDRRLPQQRQQSVDYDNASEMNYISSDSSDGELEGSSDDESARELEEFMHEEGGMCDSVF